MSIPTPPFSRTSSSTNLPAQIPDSTPLPRILCLHGGGVNAAIFKAQARLLIKHLQHSFRLVWAEGPFLCDPHPDVVTVYGSYAPFRRWLRWLPEHAESDSDSVIEEIGYAIHTAMEEDDRDGGRGEWVGLMGFSQGAKLAASLLLEQQGRERLAKETGQRVEVGLIGIPVNWRFGILLAGRAPLANLNPEVLHGSALYDAGGISEEKDFNDGVEEQNIITKPTVHVHGMADAGLYLHRKLYDRYCKPDTRVLVEWEGAHRIPFKSYDAEKVVGAVYDVAERTGVEVFRTV
ncbi:hypothetical protein GQ43DRAFT_229569 [Delitschia confertaspora ATCC 74209]|uniref:Serine hydrolase domain-containing protein n=1 Tax=Delitschia confertaspora ATCC 74209 TaxID=1513339 RepID=A0A9P4JHV4_9PLEO|nr:hypothetical protein GQ43DRAFT_229569 [Delitschia confertaspora ATCC 74209]